VAAALTRLNELSVRPDDGSEALRYVRWRGSRQDYTSARLVILVHGFNTTEPKARDSYQKFLANLARFSAARLGAGAYGEARAFWAFYWPGDHSSHAVGIVNALGVYNERKGNADNSGRSLGELIMRLSPEQEIVLVGHSMGCRVVLEALAYVAQMRLYRPGGARISAACLMAAAVPVGACDGEEARYRRRPGEPTELVLYSGNDWVLRPGYATAEWLYDSSEGPAVGATGQPEGRWLDRTAGANPPVDTNLGHRHYWKSGTSARLVSGFLAGRPPSTTEGRVGPEQRAREQQRREQAVRDEASRDVGDVLALAWQKCFDPI
jgi:pimeloyl-ACP methyl ester carboxylesterase